MDVRMPQVDGVTATREIVSWSSRPFAIGVGVGTVRIWLGLFQGLGLLDLQSSLVDCQPVRSA
jgi:hypothetical protein